MSKAGNSAGTFMLLMVIGPPIALMAGVFFIGLVEAIKWLIQ